MKVNKTTTIKFTKEQIKRLIVDYCKKEGYEISLNDIIFDFENTIRDFGRDEQIITDLKGCTISIIEDIEQC